MAPPRRTRWAGQQVENHLGLIDDALDDTETTINQRIESVNAQFTIINAKIDGLRNLMIGMLISLATASIVLALNITLR